MPGPGGGGHGGGGGRGGGFSGGGGFHGGGGRGGFHGAPPPHRPHHRPPHIPPHRPFIHFGGWHFGPRRHYHGGGLLSGVIGSIFATIIFILVIGIALVSMVADSFQEVSNGGSVHYDESSIQAYADEQYAKYFSDSAYEDNILLVVLTTEDCYDFYYIAWVGDHIDYAVSDLLGNNDTALGKAMNSYINETNYQYSLDSDLARVVKSMAQRIRDLELGNVYTCQEDHSQGKSVLVNHSQLPMTESTVNQALAQFTDITGIPCTIVVEDAEVVFGRSISGDGIFTILAIAVILVFIVISIVSNKKKENSSENTRRQNDQDEYDHY